MPSAISTTAEESSTFASPYRTESVSKSRIMNAIDTMTKKAT